MLVVVEEGADDAHRLLRIHPNYAAPGLWLIHLIRSNLSSSYLLYIYSYNYWQWRYKSWTKLFNLRKNIPLPKIDTK